MNMMMKTDMLYGSSVVLLILLMVVSQTAVAQEQIPREYVNPDEMISLDRQTSFPEAIEVLSDFASDFEERLIVDRTGFTGEIGFNVPNMHWRDALRYILRVHNMALYEDPDFYEVLTREQLEARGEERDVDGRRAPGELPMATTGTREVRINATFFEASRRALREIGVDWSTLTSGTPDNISRFLGEGTDQIPSGFDNRFVSVNAAGAQSVSQSVFNSLINFGDVGAGIEVQALFSAFEADNLGELLATPSIKVIDGEEGRIQVGEDFSIKQRDFAGNITDQFFSTGTILSVTPHVIDYQDTTFIYLDLNVERSSAQPDPVSTVISKEEASTHSLLLNGESTVIAGLYRTDRSEVRRGIPILKDLPKWFFGLRYLFGYNSTDVSQTELVVLVQAELEETIPTRLARQFQSKRELLEHQQQRHRQELDFIPTSELENRFFDEVDSEGNGPILEEEHPEEARNQDFLDTEAEDVVQQDEHPREVAEPTSEEPLHQQERRDVATEIRTEIDEPATAKLDSDNRMDLPEPRTTDLENRDRNHAALNYYTIGGTFSDEENAGRLYRELQSRGYEAHLLYDVERGLYRVAYAGFSNRREATNFTRRIQRTEQSDAWLSSNAQ